MHCTPSSVYFSVFLRTLACLRPVSNPLEFGSRIVGGWQLSVSYRFRVFPLFPTDFARQIRLHYRVPSFHPSYHLHLLQLNENVRCHSPLLVLSSVLVFILGHSLGCLMKTTRHHDKAPLTQLVLWPVAPSLSSSFLKFLASCSPAACPSGSVPLVSSLSLAIS